MKTVGLITEYNPFHLGHRYHIEQAKKLTGADTAIVIMSGSYVQRGTPSFIDKYTKSRIALNNGADLIIELPYCFSCASAEFFAYSAVTLLDKLNVVDYICFGSENDDINLLAEIAEILSDEPEYFKNRLKGYLKMGISFPAAREKALQDYIILNPEASTSISDIMQHPNNILAIEYLKALNKLKSSIKPIAIKRIEAGYHDNDVEKRLFSATAIRENSGLLNTLKEIDTMYSENYCKTFPLIPDDFSMSLGSALLHHIDKGTLDCIFGISQSLADRISNNIDSFSDFSSFAALIKTKDISYTSISRGLLHCMLDIHTETINEYVHNKIADFVRVLGFSENGARALSSISKNSKLAIITKMADSRKLVTSPHDKRLLTEWSFADKLYRMASVNKYKYISPNEYNRKIIKQKNEGRT